MPAFAVALMVFAVVVGVLWWMHRHDRRREGLGTPFDAMEQMIYEETLPEEPREWRRHYREQQAEITREARRRLGLPEEEPRRRGIWSSR
jgi:hypothetical protein